MISISCDESGFERFDGVFIRLFISALDMFHIFMVSKCGVIHKLCHHSWEVLFLYVPRETLLQYSYIHSLSCSVTISLPLTILKADNLFA